MNKKIVAAVLISVLFATVVPILLSVLFSSQTEGKIVVEKRIDAPYLNAMSKDMELIFFGYVGCSKVCTPILHQLDNFYDSPSFAPLRPYVGVTFVNLMPEVEADQPQTFAQSFNTAFEGVYLTQRQLMEIDRDFSLFFSKSLREAGEIDHSDYVYLVHREKNGDLKLINIYMTHPLKTGMIIEDIQRYKKGME